MTQPASLFAYLFLWVLSSSSAGAQIQNIQQKFVLPAALSESSGLIFFNNHLISHNDSGNDNQLFEIDTLTGEIERVVTIINASNKDWEDITQDDEAIYIGDFGNNNGSRTDLKIYKILKADYLASDTVTAESIDFSYADQNDFRSRPNNTPWDAEAMISLDAQSLVIFTKDWVEGNTKAYAVPKTPGSYQLNPMPTSLQEAGLITGASYQAENQLLLLTGYLNSLFPFIWICKPDATEDLFAGTQERIFITEFSIEQVEAITSVSENRFFISSESFSIAGVSDDGKVISFSLADTSVSQQLQAVPPIRLYPNPVNDRFHLHGVSIKFVELYDDQFKQVFQSGPQAEYVIDQLAPGFYIVKIIDTNQQIHFKTLIKH